MNHVGIRPDKDSVSSFWKKNEKTGGFKTYEEIMRNLDGVFVIGGDGGCGGSSGGGGHGSWVVVLLA